MGITVEAVRGRINRGKYKREKSEDGRVFVLLTPEQLANGHERFDERSPERSRDQLTKCPNETRPSSRSWLKNLPKGSGKRWDSCGRNSLAATRSCVSEKKSIRKRVAGRTPSLWR